MGIFGKGKKKKKRKKYPEGYLEPFLNIFGAGVLTAGAINSVSRIAQIYFPCQQLYADACTAIPTLAADAALMGSAAAYTTYMGIKDINRRVKSAAKHGKYKLEKTYAGDDDPYEINYPDEWDRHGIRGPIEEIPRAYKRPPGYLDDTELSERTDFLSRVRTDYRDRKYER